MFSCEEISCERGGRTLFEGISFDVKPKEVVVVKGDNGSGKTSLLEILSGLRIPNSGKITWKNEDIADLKEHYNKDISYLGHKNGLKRYQTVRQNIEFWYKVRDSKNDISSLIKLFKLDKVADLPCYTLSAGWQRKVSLSRLFMLDSKLWILDEPLSHVDQSGVNLFKQVLDDHISSGGSVIVTDHNIIDYGKNLYINSFSPRN